MNGCLVLLILTLLPAVPRRASSADCSGAVQDQVQDQWGAAVNLRNSGTLRYVYAQTFTPEVTGYLCALSVLACWSDIYPQSPTSFTIVDTIGGLPSSNVLGRAVVPSLACDPQHRITSWHRPIFLRTGVPYAVILETDAPESESSAGTYTFRASPTNNYTRGTLWLKGPTNSWIPPILNDSATTNLDIIFATYMLPADPAIRLADPPDGAQFRVGDEITLSAQLRPDVQAPATVAFYRDMELIGTDDTAPFTLAWSPAIPGQFDLTAVLANGAGLVATSEVARIVVNAIGPPNDDFAKRVRITSNYAALPVNNTNATLEAFEPRAVTNSAGRTVWWEWQAQRAASVTIQIEPPHRTNVVLAIYTGGDIRTLVRVTNAIGRCSFTPTAGRSYHIVVDSLTGDLTDGVLRLAQNDLEIASPSENTAFTSPANLTVTTTRWGTHRPLREAALYANGIRLDVQTNSPFSFSISLVEPGPYLFWLETLDDNGVITRSRSVPTVLRPAHDNFENAVLLTGYRTNGITSNRSATLQGDITYGSNQGGHSVWYRWVAEADGVCTITANGQGFFAVLINVCVGSTVWSLSSLANNAGPVGPVSFQAVRGTVYHISLDGYFSEEGIITWSLALRPQNDHFAQRTWVNTAHYEAIVSAAGASLEPNETRLSGSNAVASLWYSWTPPVSASATISVAASNLSSRIAIFTGQTLSSLQQVAQSGETFSENPSVSFFAVEGTQYQIGLFCSSSATNALRLILNQHVPRIVSPADGATLKALARVTLAAQFDNATNSGEMRFYVNDALLASTASPPYTFVWDNIGAGTYKIRAVWTSAGQTNSTLPTTILVYSNNIVPTPRIFAGAFGTYSYAINAVGSLSMLGSGHSQFGITDTGAAYHPRPAVGPAAVRRWSVIGAGRRGTSVFETNVWSWGLTEDGRLYRNGTDLIATPPGVMRWRDVVAASGTCFALGDNGKLYLGGTTPLDLAIQGIPWKKVAVAEGFSLQKSHATLSTDGVAYVHGGGFYGEPVSTQLQFPAGVTRWIDAQSTVYTEGYQFWFLGDNQHLYTSDGEQIRIMPPPLGVQRWTKYAAGGFHVLAIGDNGQLYAWGRNWEGQLGTGGQPIQAGTFVKVPLPSGVTAWSAVAAGYMHSVAIGNDCALYSWGNNDAGQLGIGPVLQQPLPVRVPNVGVLCGTPVVRTEGAATRLQDGSIRLHFSSDLNRSYLIQYSDDLTVWKTSVPAVIGTGGLVEWIDAGPPKTDAHPNNVPTRIYRIVFAP